MGSRMRSKGNADASRRELYLDLLVKILTNIIYGDPPIDPGMIRRIPDYSNRSFGRQGGTGQRSLTPWLACDDSITFESLRNGS